MAIKLSKRHRALLESLAGGYSVNETCHYLRLSEEDLKDLWAEVAERVQTSAPQTVEDFQTVRLFDRVERQRLEAELWASEARLTALMDISPEAVLLIEGRSGRILKVNNRAVVLFGYSPRELLNHTMEMLVPPDLQAKHVGLRNGFLGSVRKREMGYHPPVMAVTKDGRSLEMDIALTATASTDDVMVVCSPVAVPAGQPEQSARRMIDEA
ncbi:MAG: PAS domain S-box protein [Armatimonadetes bacterium]|nr:PAS domain S-box protein [Armatimonadota bacterium]